MNSKKLLNATVLVIEDNPLDAQIIVNFVEAQGGVAVCTECRETAKMYVDNLRFDLITVDLQLSNGNCGIDFINELKASCALNEKGTKFIVLTAHQLSNDEHEGLMDQGFVGIMNKPFDPYVFISHLSRISSETSVATA